MAQETLYFPHDYNPFDDAKFKALIKKHGSYGYSVFWRTVELLHQNLDHILPRKKYIYIDIAESLLITSEKVEEIIDDCICEYALFPSVNGTFWSDRVFKNIEKRKSISKQRSDAGKASVEQRKKDKELADSVRLNLTTVNEPLTTVNKERKKERN
jgi:hypothetical protein